MRAAAVFGSVLLAASYGCGAPDADSDEVELSLRPEVTAPASEIYECFGFDASALEGADIRGLRWSTPEASPVILHHAGLFAYPTAPVAGPIPCDAMADGGTALHVWAPGSGDLVLPDDTALVVPPHTRSLVVQAHAVRVADGEAGLSTLTLELARVPPAHRATWRRADAPVPTIGPHETVSSTATCRAANELHVLSTRPHMHVAGHELHAAVVRADGSRRPFVDVDPWAWDFQRTYPEDVVLAPGDGIETTCVWVNPTGDPIEEGLHLENEMCQQGLILWPAEVAPWEGPCK